MCFGKPGIHHPSPHGVCSKEQESGDERRGEQRWENIGLRSAITRQSHTWFHVRWQWNFKEETPIGHLRVSHGMKEK